MKKDEDIHSPKHYTQGSIEVIDFIEDQDMDFTLGNAIKYLSRYRFKGSGLADLKKARWYVDRLIAREEKIAKGAAKR